jgi:uncharacterized membrane protein
MSTQNLTPAGPDVTSDDRMFSALSYIFSPLVSLLVLLMEQKKDRSYPRYHAIQALGFAVAVVIYEFIAGIVYCVGSVVTLGFGAACLWILFLLPIIPALYYAYQAYQGLYFAIPVVTQMMRQQGWLGQPR